MPASMCACGGGHYRGHWCAIFSVSLSHCFRVFPWLKHGYQSGIDTEPVFQGLAIQGVPHMCQGLKCC